MRLIALALLAAALAPLSVYSEELPGLPVSVVAAGRTQVKVSVEPGVLNGMLQEPGAGEGLKLNPVAEMSAADFASSYDGTKNAAAAPVAVAVKSAVRRPLKQRKPRLPARLVAEF